MESENEFTTGAKKVLTQATRALLVSFRRSEAVQQKSPQTACLLIAVRWASMLHGMQQLIGPGTLDSFDVLSRAAIEARDLFMYFRLDREDVRKKIGYWFEGVGQNDTSWKADHTTLDEFLIGRTGDDHKLDETWRKLSVLSHPTRYASENSLVAVTSQSTKRIEKEDLAHKLADFIQSVTALVLLVSADLPGWIELDIEQKWIPEAIQFCEKAGPIATLMADASFRNALPQQSIRMPKPRKSRSPF